MKSKKKSVLIIGAGPAGLSAAWGLSRQGYAVTIIEKMDHAGGMAATFKWKQYLLDLGPHKFYTILPGILPAVKKLLGRDLLTRPKTSKIRLFDSYFDYPIEIKNLILRMGPLNAARFAFSFGLATLLNFTLRKPKNSAQYFQYRYGSAAYRTVFQPLSNKIWGKPEDLDVNLAQTRVPAPTLFQLLRGLLFGTKGQKTVSADSFHFPKKGIGQITDTLLKEAKQNGARIKYQTWATSIKVKTGQVSEVTLNDKTKINPDLVISTMHLKHLIPLISPQVPASVSAAAAGLKHRSLILLFLEFAKDRILTDSWVFFPEQQFTFNRLSEMKAFSPQIHPKNKTVLMVEITCEFDSPRWNTAQEILVKRVVSDLNKAGLITSHDKPLDSLMIKVGHCYPVYDLQYRRRLNLVLDYLEPLANLYTIGRPGIFFYDNIDHSLDMGLALSRHLSGHQSKADWRRQIEKFFTYKIVD